MGDDKPIFIKNRRFYKKILPLCISAVIGVFAVNVSAQAGVFDTLLDIILPFYDKNKKNPPTAKPTDDAIAIQDEEQNFQESATQNTNTDNLIVDKTNLDNKTSNAINDEADNLSNSNKNDIKNKDDSSLATAPKATISKNIWLSSPPSSMEELDASLPDFLLDDTLIAGDATPMLGEPDLYALLSAEFAADRGDVEDALTIYKAESFKDNATAVFERALALSIEYEEPQKSLAFATAWQMNNPEHIPAWFYVAHLALKAKDYNQAVQTLGMILDYDKRADLTQILTGIVPDDLEDQRLLFLALQTVEEDNPSISVLKAGLLMQMGDYQPAILYVNQALKADPKNLAYIMLKIDLLRLSGKDDELWQFVAQKQQEIPNEKELYLYQIRYKIENGDLTDAYQLLLTAYTKTQDADVALLTALVALDIGEYTQAIDVLKPLIQNPEFTSRAHYYLGIGYERSGDFAQSRHHYERVTDHEHALDARTKVVGFYLMDGQTDKALATLVRLRDEHEMYTADSYILQAEILLRQGDKKSAEDLLRTANQENPDDDRLLFASFKILENELSNEDKRLALDRLLLLDPYNNEYLLADAKLRLMINPQDQNALKVAKQISQLDSSDPLYDSQLQLEALKVLSNQALSQGQFGKVIEYLEVPYEVAPDLDVGILLLRGYQGLGKYDKVNSLLADLKQRFAFGQNKTGQELQEY